MSPLIIIIVFFFLAYCSINKAMNQAKLRTGQISVVSCRQLKSLRHKDRKLFWQKCGSYKQQEMQLDMEMEMDTERKLKGS